MVYVDGFNLYHGLHDQSGCRNLWLDLVALSRNLRPRSRLVRVKYFTAAVLDEPAAASRQGIYQNALEAHSGNLIEIVQGRYQRKAAVCRKCGHRRWVYEEKETDVNIATSLVADGLRDAYDDALIVSADSDLIPAIKTIQEFGQGKFVAAAFPPRRFSAELKKLLPASFHIGMSKIASSALPDEVVDPASGARFKRPAKWL